jgi:uncharacterized membrane protein
MSLIFNVLLVLHIIGGTAGIMSGTINIIRKKGDLLHKNVGKIFLYSMLMTGFSSLTLATMHPNNLLFIIGIFTIFLVGTGRRYLSLKGLAKGQRPHLVDWLLTGMMLVFGIIFISFGVYFLIKNELFGIVYLVFGLTGLRYVMKDFNYYRGQKITLKNYWLIEHIGRTMAGYLASLTALLVVNSAYLSFIPTVLLWLLPTIVFVPLIVYWSKKNKVILQ